MSKHEKTMRYVYRLYDMAEKTARKNGRAGRPVWKHVAWLANNEFRQTLRSKL